MQSDDDTPNSKEESVDTFDVPFCDQCVRLQNGEAVPMSPWIPLKRIFSDAEGVAGLFVAGIALMFFSSALKRLSLFPLILGCLPLLTGYWLMRKTWNQSRHMSVPKPTNTDLAVDFTPSIALAFEPAWRAFLFRSEQYAALFRDVNAAHLWSANSDEARAAAARRKKSSFKTNLIIGICVGAVALYAVWTEVAEFVRGWLQP